MVNDVITNRAWRGPFATASGPRHFSEHLGQGAEIAGKTAEEEAIICLLQPGKQAWLGAAAI